MTPTQNMSISCETAQNNTLFCFHEGSDRHIKNVLDKCVHYIYSLGNLNSLNFTLFWSPTFTAKINS